MSGKKNASFVGGYLADNQRPVGWSVLSCQGLFLHGLGDDYYAKARWVMIDPTVYTDEAGTDQVIANLILRDPGLISELMSVKVYDFMGKVCLKALIEMAATPEIAEHLIEEARRERNAK